MRASLLAVFLLASCAAGQPPARRSFEVASIKKNATCRGGPRRRSPGRLDFICVSVRELLVTAYGSLQGDPLHAGTIRVLGGPGWIDDERYDLSAKAEDRAPLQEMLGPMLLALLEDRFQLKAHTEPRETEVYALRLAEGPRKLQPAPQDSCKPLDLENPPKRDDSAHYCGLERSHEDGGAVIADWYGVTMAQLAGRSPPTPETMSWTRPA